MKKFTVPVEFNAISYFEVEADSAEQAEEKVKRMLQGDPGEEGYKPLLQEDTEIPGDFEVLADSIQEEG